MTKRNGTTTAEYIECYGEEADWCRRQYCQNEAWQGYYCHVVDCPECHSAGRPGD